MCFKDHVTVFSDCAINLNPDAEQLADIAAAAPPRTAKASSASSPKRRHALLLHPRLRQGAGRGHRRRGHANSLKREGSGAGRRRLHPVRRRLVDPTVAATKRQGQRRGRHTSTCSSSPTCAAGNIGYKAVQRSSGALAIGPVLQGLNKPVNDLSRGAPGRRTSSTPSP